VRGEPYEIIHEQKCRGAPELRDGKIFIGGDLRHLPRRVTEFLKKEVKKDFSLASARYAQLLGVQIRRIQIRDTITRWGSCNRSGTLCFSWRLIFAPPHVLDYLCAHEVAHLRHMDHSKKFWALVENICPHTSEARVWLKANGNTLLAIGK
jgi:predicted metal-dependent hydrolase